MFKQLLFLNLLFEEIKGENCLYATDILCQLHNHQTGLHMDDIFKFFRHRYRLEVWETLMNLLDLQYVVIDHMNGTNKFHITQNGENRLKIINNTMELNHIRMCQYK